MRAKDLDSLSAEVIPVKMNFEDRLRRARDGMRKSGIGMMFLTYGANLWYLAGIRRQVPHTTDSNAYGDYLCGAYIGADDGLILLAPRMGSGFYQLEAEKKPWVDEARIINESETPRNVLADIVKRFQLDRRGIALDDRAWIQGALEFEHVLPRSRISLASEIVAPMRMIKDADEIAVMKKAGQITDAVYGEVLGFLKEGVTEYDVSYEIDHQFAKRGVEYPSFATGVRFTKPGEEQRTDIRRATDRPLKKGHSVTFDFGTCYEGYCSDFGRTAFMGEPPAEFRKIHDLIIQAQGSAIKAMVSGKITAAQLDRVARSMIEKAGYGEGFTHRLGHGIGVTVHEPPFLYPPDETKLASNMTFTVEPSIRLLDSYSCRVEDVVMVTEKGGLPLSNFPKELTVI